MVSKLWEPFLSKLHENESTKNQQEQDKTLTRSPCFNKLKIQTCPILVNNELSKLLFLANQQLSAKTPSHPEGTSMDSVKNDRIESF